MLWPECSLQGLNINKTYKMYTANQYFTNNNIQPFEAVILMYEWYFSPLIIALVYQYRDQT